MEQKLARLKEVAKKYWDYYQKEDTVAYIQEYCQSEADELLRQADLLLEQTFVYQDRWDMEPCRTPYQMSLETWLESPNGDEEWVFMLNRHDFLPKLWYAYLYTNDEKYVEKLRGYWFDWIKKNPITAEGTWATRTIDTGIRCMNWCNLLLPMYAQGHFSDAEALQILDSIGEQLVNLRKRYIGKYSLSNWGVLQTTSMCVAYIWYGDFLPLDIEDWAWEELANQLDLQILEDGAHWEQSAMYHVEVLNATSQVLRHIRTAQAMGISLSKAATEAVQEPAPWDGQREATAGPGEGMLRREPGWLSSSVRVLSRHVLYTADPAGYQLAQCDSDVTPIDDVMARTAVLLESGAMYRQAAGAHMDMDSAWLHGYHAIAAFEDMTGTPATQRAWHLIHGGNTFVRSAWTQEANFTWVKNSTLGSGHGHTDQGHLSLYLKGRPFLVDSGRYTYREDDPLRMQLKNPAAHNICVIDGCSGGCADTSWTNESCAEVGKNYFFTEKDVHFLELPSYGTLKNGTTYGIIRRIVVLDEGVWISVQDICCNGQHQVVEYFHLDDAVSVERLDSGFCLRNGEAALCVYCQEETEVKQGIISKKYNELLEASVLEKQAVFTDRYLSHTVFADEKYVVKPAEVYQYGKTVPASEDVVQAWDVEADGTRQWTIVIWHRETFRGGKMYTCHNVPLYGKAVAIRWQGDAYQRIRIKN